MQAVSQGAIPEVVRVQKVGQVVPLEEAIQAMSMVAISEAGQAAPLGETIQAMCRVETSEVVGTVTADQEEISRFKRYCSKTLSVLFGSLAK
jgi:hypothetical protein